MRICLRHNRDSDGSKEVYRNINAKCTTIKIVPTDEPEYARCYEQPDYTFET